MTGSRVTCICMCIFTSSRHVDVQVLITSNFQRREDPQSHFSPAPWTPLTIEDFQHREADRVNCRIHLITDDVFGHF